MFGFLLSLLCSFVLISNVNAGVFTNVVELSYDGSTLPTTSGSYQYSVYGLNSNATISRAFTTNTTFSNVKNVIGVFIPSYFLNKSSSDNSTICTTQGNFNQSLTYYTGQGFIISNPSGNNSYSGTISCPLLNSSNYSSNVLTNLQLTTNIGTLMCYYINDGDYGSGFMCIRTSSMTNSYISSISGLSARFTNSDNNLNFNLYFYVRNRWLLLTDDNKTLNDNINDVNESVNDVNGSVNDVNDSINNDDVSGGSTEANGFINNNVFNDSTGLEAVITAPLNFINSLTSKSCNSITLDIPFFKNNTQITIPCLSSIYIKALGSNLYNTLSMVINGIICYRLCIEIFYIIKGAKDPDSDKVEVLDL